MNRGSEQVVVGTVPLQSFRIGSDIFVILHYALVLKRCRYFNIIEREWINGKRLAERSVAFTLLFWHILFE